MADTPTAIVEEREELMVSPSGGNPTLRIAHFLKPISPISSMDNPPPMISPLPTSPNPTPLKLAFNGWRYPQKDWKCWVDRLHPLHQSTWKKARVYEAIMGSTCKIYRSDGLILGLAEFWCTETNTFVFPWGEATITLEDVEVLGGYSVVGSPVFERIEAPELRRVEEQLNQARLQIVRSKSQKASQLPWLRQFVENVSDIEHEAFLSLWLSRFVFPRNPIETVGKHVFPIAVRLALGTAVALAPAVLASIYADLSLLKMEIRSGTRNAASGLTLWAPLQLVQTWAWERFPTLRPEPNPVMTCESRLARWHEAKPLKAEKNSRLALEDAMDSFLWRPYASGPLYNSTPLKLYREKEEWTLVSESSEELHAFARFLRVSELVGLLDCIQQYLPNRVAMQFGMDQDIPLGFARFNETPEMAWSNYSRPIAEEKLYIPPRLFESDVTVRYLEWWKQSVQLAQGAAAAGVSLSLHEQVSETKPLAKRPSETLNGDNRDNNRPLAKRPIQTLNGDNGDDNHSCVSTGPMKRAATTKLGISIQKEVDNYRPIPLGSASKDETVKSESSLDEVDPTIVELNGNENKRRRTQKVKLPTELVGDNNPAVEGSAKINESVDAVTLSDQIVGSNCHTDKEDAKVSRNKINELGLEARISKLERVLAALKWNIMHTASDIPGRSL